jgi:hypothetical protein
VRVMSMAARADRSHERRRESGQKTRRYGANHYCWLDESQAIDRTEGIERRCGSQVHCPLSVLLQRGFERNQTELSGMRWNNEFNKYKAMRGKGTSCLRVYLPFIEFKSLFPLT